MKLITTIALLAAGATCASGLLINSLPFDGVDAASANGYSTDATGHDATSWSNQAGLADYTFKGSSPLTYGNLLTTPSYLVGGGNYRRGNFTFSANSTSTWGLGGSVSSLYTYSRVDRGSFWASVLLRRDATGANIQFGLGGSNTGQTSLTTDSVANLGIQANGNNSTYSAIYKTGAGATTTTSNITGKTSVLNDVDFVVFNIEYGDGTGQITYNIWIDPDLASPGAANFTATANWADMLNNSNDQNGVKGGYFYPGSAANQASLDEIRLGTSFADVAPILVPEPSTYAAYAALVVLGLAYFRRRK